jgi:hypothetical protein
MLPALLLRFFEVEKTTGPKFSAGGLTANHKQQALPSAELKRAVTSFVRSQAVNDFGPAWEPQ